MVLILNNFTHLQTVLDLLGPEAIPAGLELLARALREHAPELSAAECATLHTFMENLTERQQKTPTE